MSWDRRYLGLVIVLALVVAGATASVAQASNKWATAGNVSATIKADQVSGKAVLSVEGNKVECSTAHLESEGEISSPATEIVMHPTYSGCSAFGFLEATWSTATTCHYRWVITARTITNLFPAEYHYRVHKLWTCESGTQTITAATCQVTLNNSQETTEGMRFKNVEGSPNRGLMEETSIPVKVKKVTDGFLCPFNGTGEVTATYTGTFEVKAFHSGSQVGFTAEGEEE